MECENLNEIRNLLAHFNEDLIKLDLPEASFEQFMKFAKYFNEHFNPMTKNPVTIGLTKDRTIQLFHKYGNLGIELCPNCFENLKGLIKDINEIKELESGKNQKGRE